MTMDIPSSGAIARNSGDVTLVAALADYRVALRAQAAANMAKRRWQRECPNWTPAEYVQKCRDLKLAELGKRSIDAAAAVNAAWQSIQAA